ncbi:energy-coupling factor ABC transporter ATP-binding protein [Thiospirochaeta perfilievii]|uniref:energy-coupling factor ABC transporter ATP-binding protein n=1 Tax=Thiospirochaeta perfilievii TaxID=252967 RepID=UPI0016594673|nr:energy-coupling factor ABC transporter ATP-binding protein [Thiospirochaeta perfilievii]
MNKPIVEFKSVNYSYDNQGYQIKNLDLTIFKNEKVGIIGANGAGKSTLLKLLLGLLNPLYGEILFNDILLNKKSLSRVRDKIGYGFQDPDNQLFMPTVYDNIVFTAKQKKIPEDKCREIADKVLLDVNGEELIDKPSYKLSGGEKRVVSLAVALSNEPELLVLDEPTVGLDPKSRRKLINLLNNRQETFLITTHDMDMAYEVCNRVIVLYKGEVVADGSNIEIFTNKELLTKTNLEMPLQLLYGV